MTGVRRGALRELAPAEGASRAGRGTAFKGRAKRLRCTLLARWEPGYAEPWFVLTDLDLSAGEVCWYGLRAWIEQGFKRLKSGGWGWQRTHMADPRRAARLWLALAVATWWCLAVGGEAEAGVPPEALPELPEAGPEPQPAGRPRRSVSVFRLGLTIILAALVNHGPLPWGRGRPEPWPTVPADGRPKAPLRKNLPQ